MKSVDTIYVIHTVRVFKIHIHHSQSAPPWYTIYDIHQLQHVSALGCHLQGVI